jgi:hypothetical protein
MNHSPDRPASRLRCGGGVSRTYTATCPVITWTSEPIMFRLRLLLLIPIAWLFVLTAPAHSDHRSQVNDHQCADMPDHNLLNPLSRVSLNSCSSYQGKMIMALAPSGECVLRHGRNAMATGVKNLVGPEVVILDFTSTASMTRTYASNSRLKNRFQSAGSTPVSQRPTCLLLYKFRNTQNLLRIYMV